MIQLKQLRNIQNVNKVGVDLKPALSPIPGHFLHCLSGHDLTHSTAHVLHIGRLSLATSHLAHFPVLHLREKFLTLIIK